jgi:hypothetical protein
MRGFRALALAAALLAAACAPTRVDIREQAAGGYTAVAFGEDEETCREARDRVKAEARFHCEARGQRASLGQMISEGVPQGCRVELPFWCTTAGL